MPAQRFAPPGRRCLVALTLLLVAAASRAQPPLEIEPGDRIVFAGNTFAERLRLFGHLETGLLLSHPEHDLTFRNLAWSADEITLRPRPLNFGDLETHLRRQEADVVLLFYGANEAWAGEEGLASFRRDLQSFVEQLAATSYSDRPPKLVLVSPVPQEQIGLLPNPQAHNRDLARYADAIRAVAVELEVPYVDLFSPMLDAMEESPDPLTINGVHLNERGDQIAAASFLAAMGKQSPPPSPRTESVRKLTVEKNRLFFDRYRAVNGYYIYGDRQEPFGVKSFPPEMKHFDELTAELDRRLHRTLKEESGGSP